MTGTVTRFIATGFLAITVGVLASFAGVPITQRAAVLGNYNMPEPVSVAAIKLSLAR